MGVVNMFTDIHKFGGDLVEQHCLKHQWVITAYIITAIPVLIALLKVRPNYY